MCGEKTGCRPGTRHVLGNGLERRGAESVWVALREKALDSLAGNRSADGLAGDEVVGGAQQRVARQCRREGQHRLGDHIQWLEAAQRTKDGVGVGVGESSCNEAQSCEPISVLSVRSRRCSMGLRRCCSSASSRSTSSRVCSGAPSASRALKRRVKSQGPDAAVYALNFGVQALDAAVVRTAPTDPAVLEKLLMELPEVVASVRELDAIPGSVEMEEVSEVAVSVVPPIDATLRFIDSVPKGTRH